MIKLKNILTEITFSLKTALPYQYEGSGKYTFQTDNNKYVVKFTPETYAPNTYEREYYDANSTPGIEYKTTNEGKALQVNATVMAITLDFIKKTPKFFKIYMYPTDSKRYNLVKNYVDSNLPSKYSTDYSKEGFIIIKNEPKDFINESKQVGNLYHFTSQDNLNSIKKNGIKFEKDNLNKPNIKYSISTTRDKTGEFVDAYALNYNIRLTLNGDSISDKYKIIPVNADHIWNPNSKEDVKTGLLFEERIISNIPGFLSPQYIISIDSIETMDWD
jgi:hypothetical protein